MIDWPASLVREVAARRCVFFLGAGISSSAVDADDNHPKTWFEFLSEACNLVRDRLLRESINHLISEKSYLLALEGIKSNVDPAEFRTLLDGSFNNPGFQPSDLHSLINELDSRIVTTTNFDKIYEKACNMRETQGAFKVVNYHSDDLCDELRSDTRLIIKAHGSIDEISKMIFTRAEYHEARSKHHRFYEVLKAIFLTNTVVFLGCGMEDPDVLLLLEDVKIMSASEKPHYVVVKDGDLSPIVLSDWKNTYNVVPLKYGPDHADLIGEIASFRDEVLSERATTGLA